MDYLFAIIFLISTTILSAESKDAMIIKCNNLTGPRVNFIDGTFKGSTDGMTNSEPTFFLDFKEKNAYFDFRDSANAIKLFKLAGVKSEGRLETGALLGERNESRYTIIQVLPPEVWTFTFFPIEEVGIFTRVGNNVGYPTGTMFKANCSITK